VQGFPYLSFLALLPSFLVPFCILFGLLALAARSSWHVCFIIHVGAASPCALPSTYTAS
jgi:hypothetical protein